MQLSDLVDPAHTAVVISEMQRGIVGDRARPPMLEMRDAVNEHGVTSALVRLVASAHRVNARVVHTTLHFRPDRAGVRIVTPLIGSEDAAIIPELAPEPRDIVAARMHGMSAFSGTELDAILRSLDITTVIAGGISLNEALIGMAIEAVNLGYRVVVPRDAVMGLPVSFADDMLKYSFRLLGSVVTVDDVVACWEPAA
jgi:nicotinamidase-related amidase